MTIEASPDPRSPRPIKAGEPLPCDLCGVTRPWAHLDLTNGEVFCAVCIPTGLYGRAFALARDGIPHPEDRRADDAE